MKQRSFPTQRPMERRFYISPEFNIYEVYAEQGFFITGVANSGYGDTNHGELGNNLNELE